MGMKLCLFLREECRLGVLEDRVLRRIFGLMMEEVARGWRRLHNQVCKFRVSPNITRMVKSRKMRWAGNVACMGM
jgi:hypothetical protein